MLVVLEAMLARQEIVVAVAVQVAVMVVVLTVVLVVVLARDNQEL